MTHELDEYAPATDLLQSAIDIVAGASERAAHAFRERTWTTQVKADGSPVTDADRAIEAWLRTEIGRRYPDDSICGEELPDRPGTSGRRWVLDPIGGTANFVSGNPYFTVDLTIEDDRGALVAATALPLAESMTVVLRGAGCRELGPGQHDFDAGSTLVVSTRTELTGARTQAHGLAHWPGPLLTRLHERVSLKDGTDSVRNLVAGRSDAIVLAGVRMGYEDLAPLTLLVEEAGGVATDLRGQPVLSGDGTVLATNGALHDQLLTLVGDPRT